MTVLVVGAGPVGLVAARLLANSGQHCAIVDRREGPRREPAAHVVNARTLEILRQAGFDMDAVTALATDPAEAGYVNFVTVLSGELIGRLPFERQGDECKQYTPTPLRNISQHRLEPLMSAEVAASPGVDLRYGVEWVSSIDDDEGVTSVLRDVTTGEERTLRSSYLLGADGAASGIRKSLDIAMHGPANIQSFVAIHILADLSPFVVGRPGVLHFVMDPAAAGTFIAHDPHREWIYMVPFDPTEETVADYDRPRCVSIVRAALGVEDEPLEIVGAGTWHMTAQVAERMRCGRVFLMGDAAHRFPPTGGMGLNTGVADAHNLVWKLAAVEAGWASPRLFETYADERLPVAAVNCQQSLSNAMKMGLLAEALGLGHGGTGDDLRAALADPFRRAAIDAAVAEQATHFDMLGLQLGYRYAAGDPAPDPSRFDPDGAVGTRVPHGWLSDGRSTLDLVSPLVLTLLTCGAHDKWAEAIGAVPVTIHHVRLGEDAQVTGGWQDLCRLGADGALLVRPDQHIAWRSDQLPADPGAALLGAVDSLLG